MSGEHGAWGMGHGAWRVRIGCRLSVNSGILECALAELDSTFQNSPVLSRCASAKGGKPRKKRGGGVTKTSEFTTLPARFESDRIPEQGEQLRPSSWRG